MSERDEMRRGAYRALLFPLLMLGCKDDRAREKVVVIDAAPQEAATPLERAPLDVTFLVSSDAHFGFGGIEPVHTKLIASMNAMAGTSYPTKLGGAPVAAPRGLVITGDLTEWGKPEEWARFDHFYGKESGGIRMPVFEMIGNHDRVSSWYVRDQVAARHDAGSSADGGGTSASRFYSWDFDALHCVALGEAPDDEGRAFLERDLASVGDVRPILLFFHFPLLGPWSTGNWFGDGPFRERFLQLIAPRKKQIIGIFHGHHHARGHYVWNGIDVYKPGPAKDGGPPSYAVVHVLTRELSVAWRDGSSDQWLEADTKSF